MTTTDEEKRGKLLTLAALIALAIFISKITQAQAQVVVWRVYMNAGIYFVVSFLGLLWAFNFKVKKRSILFLSSQRYMFFLKRYLLNLLLPKI
jgi:hypothetical protein